MSASKLFWLPILLYFPWFPCILIITLYLIDYIQAALGIIRFIYIKKPKMNSKQFLYYLGAQLPLLMLALIIVTIYTIYMTVTNTYLYQLEDLSRPDDPRKAGHSFGRESSCGAVERHLVPPIQQSLLVRCHHPRAPLPPPCGHHQGHQHGGRQGASAMARTDQQRDPQLPPERKRDHEPGQEDQEALTCQQQSFHFLRRKHGCLSPSSTRFRELADRELSQLRLGRGLKAGTELASQDRVDRQVGKEVLQELFLFQTSSLPPLQTVQGLLAQDGPPLPVAQHVHRTLELQALHQLDQLCDGIDIIHHLHLRQVLLRHTAFIPRKRRVAVFGEFRVHLQRNADVADGRILHLPLLMILVNRIISINRTTLEYCESKKLDPSDDSSVFDNFTAVFGTNPFIWFLPLQPALKQEQDL